MAETVLGDTLVLTGRRRRFDPSSGPTTETIYEGTFEAVQNVEGTLLATLPYDADYSNPPVARLTIYSQDYGETAENVNEVLQTHYELLANTSQRSAYEHRKSLDVADSTLRVIKEAIRKNTAPTTTLQGNELSLYNLLLKGQDSFFESQFVFRITQVLSRRATELSIAFSSTNRIYTSESLISETNPTGIYRAAINSAYNVVLGNYGGLLGVPAGYTLGWLKHAPTLNTVADNRVAVSIEYWLEAWSTYYYTS